MHVLQSGKPGVSASRNGSLHVVVAFLAAGAVDGDVVGAALAGAAIPRDEQVAVGALDDARGVVVLGVEREDQLGGMLRAGVCADEPAASKARGSSSSSTVVK